MPPKNKTLSDDCFAHSTGRLSHHEAVSLLRSRIAPVVGTECLPLAEAAGRILAEPAVAASPVPAHTNAAVDGYAVAAADYNEAAGAILPVKGRAAAGHPMREPVTPGAAIRILTGAVLPDGPDRVVMQEDVNLVTRGGGQWVEIPAGLKPGANIRRAGEDVAAGEMLLDAGSVIRPQDLAALASIGLGQVTCCEPLRVAIFSTGDEVVRPGEPLAPGQVYDANAPMLKALVEASGAASEDMGVLPDRPEALEAALLRAATSHDVILTSGGASVGDEDHLVATLDKIGKRHLWQLAIKPGRPLSFGQIARRKSGAGPDGGTGGDCILVGLPGNPVAVFVCFLLYVWPMLRAMSGAPWPEPRALLLPADFEVPKRKLGRREFWRATLKPLVGDNGGFAVEKFARDGSGLISGLRAADGLIEVPEDVEKVERGDMLRFIPFSEFGILGR